MNIVRHVRRWFYIGSAGTPAGRALLIEQFRILTSQIPVLYGVLIVDSTSVAYVLPTSLPWWLRLGVPGALLLISAARMIYWLRLRSVVPTPEQALKSLFRMRILASALNAAFSIWTFVLFDSVDPGLRAPLALLVFMSSVGSAYCLGSFPSAARLTLAALRASDLAADAVLGRSAAGLHRAQSLHAAGVADPDDEHQLRRPREPRCIEGPSSPPRASAHATPGPLPATNRARRARSPIASISRSTTCRRASASSTASSG